MEIEQSTQMMTKKLWKLVRIVFFMLRKCITKSKIAVDLHLMLKRGKLASKTAISNLILQYTSSKAIITPREYEFSCSNSPAFNFHPMHANIKRKLQRNSHHLAKSYKYDDVTTFSAVQRVLEMLNHNSEKFEPPSPMVLLPGFGRSPMVKQLRVTDSPFPLKEDDADSMHVDMAAEDFIKRFYKDLKLQKNLAIESPYNDTWGR